MAQGVRAKKGQLASFFGLLPASQGHNLALTVLCVPESGLDCFLCARISPFIMCQNLAVAVLYVPNLALTILYVPESRLACLECAKICRWMSYMCQNLALTVLYVLESDFDCLICARIWP